MDPVASRAARHGVRLLAYSHITVDFYQGAIAALVPFFVFERHFTYAAAAGIVLAATLSSSIVQPLFGVLDDRWHLRGLTPVSIFCAGAGIALIAFSDAYWFTVTMAAVSGIGVAAFHPVGASQARQLSGNNHAMMAWFSLGGNIGFAVAPLVVAATVGVFGLRASPLLLIPALSGVVAVLLMYRLHVGRTASNDRTRVARGRNDWPSFLRMASAIIFRSIVFVGIGAFIVLFMYEYRGMSETVAAAALFVFYVGGAFGTAIGGYLARRWSRTSILRGSYLLAVPIIAGMLLTPGPVAFGFILLASIVLYVPFSLHVTLGQDYLPRNMGTASGVTLGLAVSVGGVASPAIGALADNIGLEYALLPLIALPALAYVVLLGLKDPRYSGGVHKSEPATASRQDPLSQTRGYDRDEP